MNSETTLGNQTGTHKPNKRSVSNKNGQSEEPSDVESRSTNSVYSLSTPWNNRNNTHREDDAVSVYWESRETTYEASATEGFSASHPPSGKTWRKNKLKDDKSANRPSPEYQTIIQPAFSKAEESRKQEKRTIRKLASALESLSITHPVLVSLFLDELQRIQVSTPPDTELHAHLSHSLPPSVLNTYFVGEFDTVNNKNSMPKAAPTNQVSKYLFQKWSENQNHAK